jgi:hypothetical protein
MQRFLLEKATYQLSHQNFIFFYGDEKKNDHWIYSLVCDKKD